MQNYPITLPVPDYVYERARRIAEATGQPLERVLVRQLEDAFAEPLPILPPDEQRELDALANLSDEALWTIAREQMPDSAQTRMQVLMDGNSLGTLNQAETAEMEKLSAQGQRLMLRKAQAAALLTERGHTVTVKDMSGSDE